MGVTMVFLQAGYIKVEVIIGGVVLWKSKTSLEPAVSLEDPSVDYLYLYCFLDVEKFLKLGDFSTKPTPF